MKGRGNVVSEGTEKSPIHKELSRYGKALRGILDWGQTEAMIQRTSGLDQRQGLEGERRCRT